eukprot:PRCOL_00004121-RA
MAAAAPGAGAGAGARGGWRVHAALVAVQLIAGLYHVVLKVVLNQPDGVPPMVFLTYRTAAAATVLALAAAAAAPRRAADALAALSGEHGAAASKARTSMLPSKQAMASFALLGLVGVAMNMMCFTAGTALTSPAVAASVQPTVPVFTFVLAICTGLDSVAPRKAGGKQKLLGMIAATLGAWVNATWLGPELISAGGQPDLAAASHSAAAGGNAIYQRMLPEETQPFAHAVGVLSLLLNCFAIAAYLSLQERLPVQDYSTVVVTAWTFALGLVPVAWLALLRTPDPLNWLLSYKELFAVMYAGAGPSAVNFFLLSYATRNVGPSITAAYLPLQPLASSTLQFLILGAPVRAGSVAGATLALFGVYLVMRGKRIAEKAAEASAARTQGSKRLGVPSRV